MSHEEYHDRQSNHRQLEPSWPRPWNCVRTVRQREEVSLNALARRTRLKESELERLEDENCDLPVSMLYRLAEGLRVPVEELLPGQKSTISEPIRQRASLLRIARTAHTILAKSKHKTTRHLAQTLVRPTDRPDAGIIRGRYVARSWQAALHRRTYLGWKSNCIPRSRPVSATRSSTCGTTHPSRIDPPRRAARRRAGKRSASPLRGRGSLTLRNREELAAASRSIDCLVSFPRYDRPSHSDPLINTMNSFPASLYILSISSWLIFSSVSLADEPSADELAIRQAIQSYSDAFNRHDAGAVAEHWSPTGEFVLPSGSSLRGREEIAKEFTAYFAETPDVRVEVAEPSIEFLSPNVAVETGSAVVLFPDQEPVSSEYVAIHMKTPQGWKMDSVREVEAAESSPHNEHLQELDWMIGSWVDESESSDIRVDTVCRWTKNHSFMTRSFKVFVEGRADAEGTQVIGWDPRNETIRSWGFTSEGGFGVGAWSRDGNRWSVSTINVMPDGRKGSFTAIFEKLDDNSFEFSTVGREIEGELMPNIDPVVVVRK